MLNRNTVVRPLAEELAEIGLDPEKTLGDISRSNKLIEARMGGNSGGGAPQYLRRVQPPAEEPEGQQEADGGDGAGDGDSDEGGLSISEAMKVIRMRRLTSSEKSKGRRLRRKMRSKRKASGKAYRRRSRRRISRIGKLKRKRYGAAGLAKLHKARRRIVMSDNKELANLREDLNQISSEPQASSVFEDAAYQSGLLAMYLGEMFEAIGDEQSAETMFDVSDAAADLSERLVGVDAESDLSEEDGEMLQRVMDSLVKGLRMYEAMGSPSLGEVIEFVEANGKKKADEPAEGGDEGDGDEGDDGDDEDDEDDDEDE